MAACQRRSKNVFRLDKSQNLSPGWIYYNWTLFTKLVWGRGVLFRFLICPRFYFILGGCFQSQAQSQALGQFHTLITTELGSLHSPKCARPSAEIVVRGFFPRAPTCESELHSYQRQGLLSGGYQTWKQSIPFLTPGPWVFLCNSG